MQRDDPPQPSVCQMAGKTKFKSTKKKQSSWTEVHLNLKILTNDPLIGTMNHPVLKISNQMEEFISIQKVK